MTGVSVRYYHILTKSRDSAGVFVYIKLADIILPDNVLCGVIGILSFDLDHKIIVLVLICQNITDNA